MNLREFVADVLDHHPGNLSSLSDEQVEEIFYSMRDAGLEKWRSF